MKISNESTQVDQKPSRHRGRFFTLVVIVVLLVGMLGFALYHYLQVREDRQNLTAQVRVLEDKLTKRDRNIEALENKSEGLQNDLEDEKEKVEALSERVEEVTGSLDDAEDTVDRLEKRQELDPELLKKYSKVYFLNENYEPNDLEDIDDEHLVESKENTRFHEKALPFLEDMIDEADEDGIELRVLSAYRSFHEQQKLKDSYNFRYGAQTANQFSAAQGYSEHQLGTTVDFSTPALGGALRGFGRTEAFSWLEENAHEYGFILSYPEGNSYYQYEPWHWRFVGTELAEDLGEDNERFYSTDQDEIDEYLVEIFE